MSSLKLKHSGGNSVSIAAPSSNPAANRTITVPSTADGTMLTTTNPKAGNILQVVQAVKTDIATTTSATFGALSGLSVNITPSATSSKILVTVDCKIGNEGNGAYIKLVRDSTDIYKGDAQSGKLACLHQTYGGSDTGEGQYGLAFMGGTFLDSPSTTSQVTYAVQWLREGSGTIYINRNSSDSSDYVGRTASSITVMEVAG